MVTPTSDPNTYNALGMTMPNASAAFCLRQSGRNPHSSDGIHQTARIAMGLSNVFQLLRPFVHPSQVLVRDTH